VATKHQLAEGRLACSSLPIDGTTVRTVGEPMAHTCRAEGAQMDDRNRNDDFQQRGLMFGPRAPLVSFGSAGAGDQNAGDSAVRPAPPAAAARAAARGAEAPPNGSATPAVVRWATSLMLALAAAVLFGAGILAVGIPVAAVVRAISAALAWILSAIA
jgi:hypothetical protein